MLNRSIPLYLCPLSFPRGIKPSPVSAARRSPSHIPFLGLKKFSIKRSECPGPSTSNATTGNNAWPRGASFHPRSDVCTSRRQADCRWRRRKHPLSRDVPNNGCWIKGARGSRIRGSHARTAAPTRLIYELARVSGSFLASGI